MTTTLQRNSVNDLELNPAMSFAINQSTHPVYAFLSVQGDSRPEVGTDGINRQAFYLHQLGLELAQRGCQVDIFIRREHPEQPEIVKHRQGLRTIRLTAGPVMVIPHTQVLEELPAFVDAWLAFQSRSERNYVLFQTSDWLSGWVGLQLRNRLGLPLVHTSQAISTLKSVWRENCQTMSIHHSVERTCLGQADCVVAGSPQEVADLRQMILLRGQSKVVPWGVDTQHFGSLSQATARQRLGISPETRLILYVGQFGPLHGVETLIKACGFLPKPFQLYLVSNSSKDEADVEEQQHLRTLVKQMDMEEGVVFTGMVPRSYLPAYYAAAKE